MVVEKILVVVIVIGIIAYGVWYYYTHIRKSGEYIWVGPGKDPFKKSEKHKSDEEE